MEISVKASCKSECINYLREIIKITPKLNYNPNTTGTIIDESWTQAKKHIQKSRLFGTWWTHL